MIGRGEDIAGAAAAQPATTVNIPMAAVQAHDCLWSTRTPDVRSIISLLGRMILNLDTPRSRLGITGHFRTKLRETSRAGHDYERHT